MGTDNKSLEEENSEKIERFLKSKGAELVAFANLEGIKNVPPEYQNSILIAIPIEKEALKTIYTDEKERNTLKTRCITMHWQCLVRE